MRCQIGLVLVMALATAPLGATLEPSAGEPALSDHCRSSAGESSAAARRELRELRKPAKYPKKKAPSVSRRGFHNSGSVLLSHRASPAVPSALIGLTSEFGMGSGVTLPTLPPNP